VIFQGNTVHGLGEVGNKHELLDSCIGKMFKKERRKSFFLGKMMGGEMSGTADAEQTLRQAQGL
jgi:hypothetical protein